MGNGTYLTGVVLIYIFRMGNDTEHLFMSLLAICMYLLEAFTNFDSDFSQGVQTVKDLDS